MNELLITKWYPDVCTFPKWRCSRQAVKAAADAGLICSLQQEGVPPEKTPIHCAQICRCSCVRVPINRPPQFGLCLRVFFLNPDRAFLDVSPPGGITAGGKATEEAGLADMEARRPCGGSEL